MTKRVDLVLLHGWGFDCQVWKNLAESWSYEFNVHLIDLPGIGKSVSQPFPDSINDLVVHLLQRLPKKATYIGWSLGGLIAQAIALHAPERVSALLTLASTPCFLQKPNWQGVSPQFMNDFYQLFKNNPRKALRQFYLLSFKGNRQYCSSINIQYDHHSLLNALVVLQKTDLRSKIEKIQCPTCFCVTSNDPLAKYNKKVHTHILPIEGHAPILTHPQIINDLFWKFMYESKFVPQAQYCA